MPANQLITQPRKENDLRILMADADTMPQTYYLRDVFSEVVGRIDKCKKDGTMFRFRAVYAPVPVVDGRMQKTGMIAVDPNSIILVGEEPKETGNNEKQRIDQEAEKRTSQARQKAVETTLFHR